MTSTSRSKVMDEELEAIQRVDRRERLKRARERRERRAKMSKVNLNVTREPEDIYEEDLCFYEKMFDHSGQGRVASMKRVRSRTAAQTQTKTKRGSHARARLRQFM